MCLHMHSHFHPIYTHVPAHACTPTGVSACVHMHTHVYALTYTHVPAHTGTPTGVSSRVHMHTHVYALTYTHVPAHTGTPTDVCSGVPMCTLSCLHSHVHTYACTQMHNYRCALRCTHSHTCTLLCTLPLLFMAHGSVSTPLSRPRDKRRVLQEPSAHHSRGNREDPSPSTSRHLQSALASERPLTYTGPADFIFLLHA